MDYYGGDPNFDLFTIMFFIMFMLIVSTIIISAIKGFTQWSYNNEQPILDVNCKVVSKRTNVTRHAGHTDGEGHFHHGSTSTDYYITFEVESGDRMEFNINGKEFGMLAEGDTGILKFQGTRYLGFKRNI